MDRVVRWGGLLASIAMVTALHYHPTRRVEAPASTPLVEPIPTPSPVWLDEPPRVPDPSPQDIERLTIVARKIEPAMMMVGDPGGDSGSAFVISRKHRLLATNAHVATIMDEAGGMVAIQNRSTVVYTVEKVWYHPDHARARSRGVNVHWGGGWARYRGDLNPDVAVLLLAAGGPELPEECVLARSVKAIDLASLPVGQLGFSGPTPMQGDPIQAVFKTGAVSLLTDFTTTRDHSARWMMVNFSAPSGDGDSGGPVFSKDGQVIAVHAWGWKPIEHEGRWSATSSAGIRVDALWELLDHHGLTSLVDDGQ